MVRLARVLWVAWAVIVWNVVFDRIIVVAGRDYIRAAVETVGSHPRMDDWMRPAVTRGFWISSACAIAILAVGLTAIARASRAQQLVAEG